MRTIKDVRIEAGLSDGGIKRRMRILGINGPLLTDDEAERLIVYKPGKDHQKGRKGAWI